MTTPTTPNTPANGGQILTDSMLSKAGRALADRSADSCNVNREDNWKTYGNEFIEDARMAFAAIEADLRVSLAAPVTVDSDEWAPTFAYEKKPYQWWLYGIGNSFWSTQQFAEDWAREQGYSIVHPPVQPAPVATDEPSFDTFRAWHRKAMGYSVLERDLPYAFDLYRAALAAPAIPTVDRNAVRQPDVPKGYVLALQTVVELPDGGKELGYTLLDGFGIFTAAEEVHAAIDELSLPLGWVSMTTDQLLPGWMLPAAPAAQPAAQGAVLTEDEQLALMVKVEDYMGAVDWAGTQTHAKCDAAEAAIFAKVNEIISYRATPATIKTAEGL